MMWIETSKSSEKSDRREKVISGLYTATQKSMAELESNSERNIQTQEQFAPVHQKLEGANNKIEGEVRRSIGSVLQRCEAMVREDTNVVAKLLNKTCVGDTRIECKGGSSVYLHPCLEFGKWRPEIGDRRQTRTKNSGAKWQKMELGADSIMTEKEGKGKQQKAERIPTQWAPTNDWSYNERLDDLNYQNWRGASDWGEVSTPSSREMGVVSKKWRIQIR